MWNNYNIITNAGVYLQNIYGGQEWHDNDEGVFHYARSYMHYGFEDPKGIEGQICPLLRYPPGSPEETELIKYEHNMEIQEEASGVPDFLIFGALAIREAWDILERVLYYGERKSIDILSDFFVANKLLDKAYRMKIDAAKKNIQEADKNIDALVKHNESIMKDNAQREESERKRIANIRESWKNKNEPIQQAYIDEAIQIQGHNSLMKVYAIIASIQRKIFIGKVKKELIGRKDSSDTIRRYLEPLFPITPKKRLKNYPQR